MSWQLLEERDGHKWELDEGRQLFRIDGLEMEPPEAIAEVLKVITGRALNPGQAQRVYESWYEGAFLEPGRGKTTIGNDG